MYIDETHDRNTRKSNATTEKQQASNKDKVRNQKTSTVKNIKDFYTIDGYREMNKEKAFRLLFSEITRYVRNLNVTTQKDNRNSSPQKEQNKL